MTKTKTALVTGASEGIGAELAKVFAQNNHNLVLVARSTDKLNQLAAELQAKYHITATVITKDLSQPSSAQEIYTQVHQLNINIDVLINNAGFGYYGQFDQTDWSRQHELLQVNITSLVQLTHLFLKDMRQQNSGQILNIASTAGFLPGPLMATYYASKAFVISFSEALHNELGDSGITVTCICPGVVSTNFAKHAGAQHTKLFNGLQLNPTTVAQIGYNSLMQGKSLVVINWINKLMIFSLRFAPRFLVVKAIRYIQEQRS